MACSKKSQPGQFFYGQTKKVRYVDDVSRCDAKLRLAPFRTVHGTAKAFRTWLHVGGYGSWLALGTRGSYDQNTQHTIDHLPFAAACSCTFEVTNEGCWKVCWHT